MTWLPLTEADVRAMLDTIGAATVEDLFDVIPEPLRVAGLDLPDPMSEMAVSDHLERIAAVNDHRLPSFVGGGFYDHYVPAAVDALAGRSEFATAYTPYQPECAQGTLQAIYEYQSAICRLTEMDFANASLYDGGTAVFEAATMAVRCTKRRRVVCHDSVNPIYRRMLETHIAHLGLTLVDGDDPTDAACVIVQNPAFRGEVRRYDDLAERCHAAGALLVVSFNPVSLGLVAPPGEMGADIAIAEGQSIGLPLQFGGPYLGILATRQACVRRMPGRIAGQTVDEAGRRGFVLTLQAREQHIRREKAMSNICSNEALCALRALIHLCLLGPQGLKEVAVHCHAKAEHLKRRLREVVEVVTAEPTFNEFVIRLPKPAEAVVEAMARRGIAPGLPLAALDAGDDRELLVAVTERRTRAELDAYVDTLQEELCS